MMTLEAEICKELEKQGADFVHFVNISQLPKVHQLGFPTAILMGMALSPSYLLKIIAIPDYVEQMVRNRQTNNDEFNLKEKQTDRMADDLATLLIQKGYSAYSQSEDHLLSTGAYNETTKISILPHKTIALMAGLGWIGKHNLMVSPLYGSAFSMCTVLTNAPLKTIVFSPEKPGCGPCKVCVQACPTNALKGKIWDLDTTRDELVDVYACTTCLRCLALCLHTQQYVNRILNT